MGILQARILKWVAMPPFRGSSWPRHWTQVCRISGGFFTVWATREAQEYCSWVAYPFSRGSSWPKNLTGVSCIAGGFFTSWANQGSPSNCHQMPVNLMMFSNLDTRGSLRNKYTTKLYKSSRLRTTKTGFLLILTTSVKYEQKQIHLFYLENNWKFNKYFSFMHY